MPLISVIIPARNAEAHVRAALESIENQTFRDFEVVVINDGSSDGTPEIVQSFVERDSRFRILTTMGIGVAAALNLGIRESTGEFIARMDADDISHNDRFDKQLEHLRSHPATSAVGTGYVAFGEADFAAKVITGTQRCKLALGAFNPIAHPTVMMRRAHVAEGEKCYDESIKYSQDYDLFTRLSRVGNIDNIPDHLLNYRVHSRQIGQAHRGEQLKFASSIRARALKEIFGFKPRNIALKIALMGVLAVRLGPASWKEVARAIRNEVRASSN